MPRRRAGTHGRLVHRVRQGGWSRRRGHQRVHAYGGRESLAGAGAGFAVASWARGNIHSEPPWLSASRSSSASPSPVTRDTWRAMSQENVETVQRAVEAWNADDLDAFL